MKKNRKKSGVPKKSEKIPDFLKIREKKSGGTKNTRNSRSQCLVTLGRDKTQRNPSLNFKGISFVISNIVPPNIIASNIVPPNIIAPNIVPPNIVTPNIVPPNIVTL